jgi:hypothetical protein
MSTTEESTTERSTTGRSTTSKDRLRAALARIVEPVAMEYRTIVAELEELETRRTELTEARREAIAILRHVDPDNPDWAPKTYANPKPKPVHGPSRRQSAEQTNRLEQLRQWLREHQHANGHEDGFYAAGVMKEGLPYPTTKETLVRDFRVLADEGFLRLDHLGGANGRGRFFKLVEEG